MLWILIAEGRHFPEVVSAFFRMGPDVGEAKLAAYLQRCIDKGLMRPLDPRFMSRAFRSMILEDSAFRVAAGVTLSDQRNYVRTQINTAVSIFLFGSSRQETTPGLP